MSYAELINHTDSSGQAVLAEVGTFEFSEVLHFTLVGQPPEEIAKCNSERSIGLPRIFSICGKRSTAGAIIIIPINRPGTSNRVN